MSIGIGRDAALRELKNALRALAEEQDQPGRAKKMQLRDKVKKAAFIAEGEGAITFQRMSQAYDWADAIASGVAAERGYLR